MNFFNLIVKLLNFHLILLSILINFGKQLLNDGRLSMIHFVFQCLRFFLNFVIFSCHCFQVARHPLGWVNLRFTCNCKKIWLLFIPKFTQVIFGFENIFHITIFNRFLFDINFHLPEFCQFLLELLSERVFLDILWLELSESLIWFFESLSDITILLLTHANGLILLGQWNSIWLISLL